MRKIVFNQIWFLLIKFLVMQKIRYDILIDSFVNTRATGQRARRIGLRKLYQNRKLDYFISVLNVCFVNKRCRALIALLHELVLPSGYYRCKMQFFERPLDAGYRGTRNHTHTNPKSRFYSKNNHANSLVQIGSEQLISLYVHTCVPWVKTIITCHFQIVKLKNIAYIRAWRTRLTGRCLVAVCKSSVALSQLKLNPPMTGLLNV